MTRQEFDNLVKMGSSDNENDRELAFELIKHQHPIIFRCWCFTLDNITNMYKIKGVKCFWESAFKSTQKEMPIMSKTFMNANLDKFLEIYDKPAEIKITSDG